MSADSDVEAPPPDRSLEVMTWNLQTFPRWTQTTSLVADFYETFDASARLGGPVDHPLNQDNIYSSDIFKNRIGRLRE